MEHLIDSSNRWTLDRSYYRCRKNSCTLRKLYFEVDNCFFEQLEVDNCTLWFVGFIYIVNLTQANGVVSICYCQANTVDELPERLIGAVRVSHIELKSAIVPNLDEEPSG